MKSSQTLQHVTLPCDVVVRDDVKKKEARKEISFSLLFRMFTSSSFFSSLFSSLMLWVTFRFHSRSKRGCEGENAMLLTNSLSIFVTLLYTFWVVFYFFFFGWNLKCFFTKLTFIRGRKGDRLLKKSLLLVFVFAYNNVRSFKWRDIYWIIVELVRCSSSALSNFLNRKLFFFSFTLGWNFLSISWSDIKRSGSMWTSKVEANLKVKVNS